MEFDLINPNCDPLEIFRMFSTEHPKPQFDRMDFVVWMTRQNYKDSDDFWCTKSNRSPDEQTFSKLEHYLLMAMNIILVWIEIDLIYPVYNCPIDSICQYRLKHLISDYF